MKWIISRREDLLWFHLSALPALALGALFAFGPRAAELPLLLAWGILFDGTHVYATWARSYLAGDENLPGARSLWLLAVGPAAALIDHFVVPIFPAFLLAAYLWAYWHLVRQHWGFVALYGRDTQLAGLLWLGCLYPFARFGLSDAYLASGLPRLFPSEIVPALRMMLDAVAGGAFLVIAALRTSRLGPAHLYVGIVVALHALTFAFVPRLLPIMATLTLFHNLAYHRIVHWHEERRGRPLALLPYAGAGLLVGVAWYVPRLALSQVAPPLLANLLYGAGWGVAFHHYLVDGRIWRRKSLAPRLEQVLR
jgi:hypothetical protein